MKKKKGKSDCKHFRPVNLYREHLEHIIDIFSESCGKVEISDDEFEYENLDELKRIRGLRPKKISIRGRDPDVFLDLNRNYIYLHRSTSDQNSIYVYKMVEDILQENKNLLGILFAAPVLIVFVLGFFIVLKFVPSEVLKQWFPSKVSAIAFLLVLLGFPLMSLGTCFGGFSYISLNKKHEEKDFFYRNKEDIIKVCLGAIMGAIVTWLLTKIL
jgi:hypothetical protein